MKNRIQDLRTDADLRQIDVATAIGITQRKYSYIETGTQQVTDEILIKLAEFYNTSVDYLIGRTDVKDPYPRK
ncbi:MAG: helix-turn-helix domain-containing protein [Oscillospiraceae bacterium]|nr:helix-turn-helix domain-containing protein [Oscillospiraceae bacterium]